MLYRSICSALMVETERDVSRIDLPNPKTDSTFSPGRLPRSPLTTISSISAATDRSALNASVAATTPAASFLILAVLLIIVCLYSPIEFVI